jgi:putative hydrolase of HD superfamily
MVSERADRKQESLELLMSFIREADQLKSVERKTTIYNGARLENSAEHSWHLALAVMLFASHAPAGVDLNRAIKMAILHDLVEIDAGDVLTYNDLTEQKQLELKALDRLMGLLPEPMSSDFKQIWLEFEAGESPASRYVRALDRFLPVYSNLLNSGRGWRKHGISAKQVLTRNEPPIGGALPELWDVTRGMLTEAESSGFFA